MTLAEAMALVFAVMFLFLQNVRYTIIPTIVVPVALLGLAGGIFNTAGNLSGIVTLVVIGYILQSTGSFEGARRGRRCRPLLPA